ncbi:MAG TPA: hypothetical protein VF516_41400 [Kofleriaceae bacterium]
MPDDTNEHFFACNLLWWSLRVSFGRSELLQVDELAERIEEYDDRLEELGAWLMAEFVRAGPTYLVDGQKKGISSIDPAEIEQRLTRSLKALEELAVSVAPTAESRAYCAYVAECSWVVAILRAFADLERNLSSDDASARYREIQDECTDLIGWIEVQRDAVAAERIPADSRGALHGKIEPVIDAAVRVWRDEVRAYSSRYPRSGSEARRS